VSGVVCMWLDWTDNSTTVGRILLAEFVSAAGADAAAGDIMASVSARSGRPSSAVAVPGRRYIIAVDKGDPTSHLAYAVYTKGRVLAIVDVSTDRAPKRAVILKLATDQYDALP